MSVRWTEYANIFGSQMFLKRNNNKNKKNQRSIDQYIW